MKGKCGTIVQAKEDLMRMQSGKELDVSLETLRIYTLPKLGLRVIVHATLFVVKSKVNLL